MNSVSWFLYAADVSGSMKNALIPVCAIAAGVAAITTGLGIFMHCGNYSWVTDADRAWWEQRRGECAGYARKLWPAAAIMLLVIIAIPSQNTMYAIAASEVGERVVKSEAAQGIASDATKALQNWLKKQIEPDKKP
jgi:hypothetical protein